MVCIKNFFITVLSILIIGAPGVASAIGWEYKWERSYGGEVITDVGVSSTADVLYDAVMGKAVCCNCVSVGGKKMRNASDGDFMYCGLSNLKNMVWDLQGNLIDENTQKHKVIPFGVRKCVTGWDDDWENECIVNMCGDDVDNYPADFTGVVPQPMGERYCWTWTCKDGYEKKGNRCVDKNNTRPEPDPQPEPKPENGFHFEMDVYPDPQPESDTSPEQESTPPALSDEEVRQYNALIRKIKDALLEYEQGCL